MRACHIVDSITGGWASKTRLNGFGMRRPDGETFYVSEGELLEAKDFVFGKKGGIVAFSTEVNAAVPEGQTLLGKIKAWATRWSQTIRQRVGVSSMVNKVVGAHPEVYGFTVGKGLSGRYKANDGRIFDEHSMTLEVVGIDSKDLESVATDMAREFHQESVLVKDYQTGEIYLANQK